MLSSIFKKPVGKKWGLLQNALRPFSKVFGFKTKYPELYKHVHSDSLPLFEQPWIGSKQLIKWKCEMGPDHIWESELKNRIISFDKHKRWKKVSVTNSLATRYPDLAKEWYVEKNGAVTPKDVTYGSSKDYWWQCPKSKDHIYLASPNDRTYNHRSCPYCANLKVSSTNNLAALYPDLASQWDREKNGDKAPETTLPSSHEEVWWRCRENPSHVWTCPVALRVHRNWNCPYCSRRRFGDTSLASLYPGMARDWDYDKNLGYSPQSLSPNSEKVVYWKCPHGVEWKQSIVSRKHSFLNNYHRCILCRQELNQKK